MNESRLPRPLLDALAVWPIRLGLLGDHITLKMYCNQFLPEFNLPALAQSIVDDHASGIVVVAIDAELNVLPTLTRDWLIQAMSEPRPAHIEQLQYLMLTKKGGAIWEQAARPQWSKFYLLFDEGPDDANRRRLRIQALSGELLEMIRDNLQTFGYEQISGSRQPQPVCQWQATYWKQFPQAWELTLSGIELVRQAAPNESSTWLEDLDTWYSRETESGE
jgi:hypothetical protein